MLARNNFRISNEYGVFAAGLICVAMNVQGCTGAECSNGMVDVDGRCVPSVRTEECGECPESTPYCDTSSEPDHCVQCLVDANCPSSAPACSTTHECVTCDQSNGTGGGCVAVLQDLSVRIDGIDQIGEFSPLETDFDVHAPLWTNTAEFTAQFSSAEHVAAIWPGSLSAVDWLGSAKLTTLTTLDVNASLHVSDSVSPAVRLAHDYAVHIHRGTRTQFSDATTTWQYGTRVEIDGDRLAVAAQRKAVFLYQRVGSAWSLMQTIQRDTSLLDNGDRFAWDIALSGNHLAITVDDYGCGPGVSTSVCGNNRNRGAVLLYHFNGSQFVFQQLLLASNNYKSEYFGTSVAISGDRMAVGARGETSLTTGCQTRAAKDAASTRTLTGAVYTFNLNASNSAATQTSCIKAPVSGSPQPHFGAAIDMQGDLIVAGAPNAFNGTAGDGGLAYMIRASGGSWGAPVELNVGDFPSGQVSRFGTAVAISGSDIAIGAPNSNAGFLQSVYMFNANDGSLRPYQTIPVINRNLYSDFGQNLDLDGDKMAVSSAELPGNAYAAINLFKKQGSVWSLSAITIPPGQVNNGVYSGYASVAVSADHVFAGVTGVIAVWNEANQFYDITGGAGTLHIYE